MTTDDDRAAYLEGEDSTVPDAKERRALDGIRELLADPAVWNEPGPGLEAEIVAAIGTLDAHPTALSASSATIGRRRSRSGRRVGSRHDRLRFF